LFTPFEIEHLGRVKPFFEIEVVGHSAVQLIYSNNAICSTSGIMIGMSKGASSQAHKSR